MHDTDQLRGITERNLKVSRGFGAYGLYGVLASLAISGFLIAWITLVTGSFHLRAALFLFALPWVLLGAGSLLNTALRLPSFFALDLLTGVTVLSVIILGWKVWVPLSLWVLIIFLLVAVVLGYGIVPRGRCARLSAPGLLAIIVSLVAATGWSQDLLAPRTAADGYVVFKPWSDFFFHASVVARSLNWQTLSQVGNYEWQGFPPIFYHYASYGIVTCLAKVGVLLAYDAVVGFWTPFGSFLAALASYAIGRVLWSQGAGLAALLATALVPDLGLLGLAHPTYSYFWLQHISPAGLYGIAIGGTALILVIQGARAGRRLWIAAGVIMGGTVCFFKVQIFAAAFPLLVAVAIVTWPPRTRWRWLVLAACAAGGVALVPVIGRFYIGPHIRFGFADSWWHWKILADMAIGTPVESWYRVFTGPHSLALYLVRAIGLLLFGALGVFAILAPVVWLMAAWGRTWTISESISVATVAILVLMTFGIRRNGSLDTAYEFIHRPFVWAYWLVGSLTGGRIFSIIAAGRSRLCTSAAIGGVILFTAVPIVYGRQLQRGAWPQGNAHASMRVDRGLIECARYVREQRPPDAVAQDSRLDEFLILGGLCQRPSFAARLSLWKLLSDSFRASPYQERLRTLQNLQQATNIEDLQRSVRETGIRWYVVHPGDPNVWPAEFRDHPAFESHGYKVYDMQRCFDLPKN